MPEGPELHLAARLVNKVCAGVTFAAPVIKSQVSKSPEVNFDSQQFHISAQARGKELKMFLHDIDDTRSTKKGSKIKPEADGKGTHLLFHFGMSGCFQFTPPEEIHKHAHLRFHTKDKSQVLSFVDTRRFGNWAVKADWGKDRGPDPMLEYQDFRANILSNLSEAVFNKPICEVMMNQKYFNGIGNYLRAEILHRCHIRPFDCARDILSSLTDDGADDKNNVVKKEVGDVLETTRNVMLEYKVPSVDPSANSAFEKWLRCYDQYGMKTLTDANKRTVWFSGEAGALAPKGQRPKVIMRKSVKKENKSKSKATRTLKKESKDEEVIANGAKKRKKVAKVKEDLDKKKEVVNGTRTSKRRSSSRIAAAS